MGFGFLQERLFGLFIAVRLPEATAVVVLVVEELLYLQNRKQGAYPVVPGTGDILRIEHDGSDAADIIYQIVIVGASV